MSDPLEPLSESLRSAIQDAWVPVPSAGAQERVAARLATSLAVAATVAPGGGARASVLRRWLGAWGLPFGLGTFALGVAGGAWLQARVAREQPPVVVPVPPVAAPAPRAAPPSAPPVPTEPPVKPKPHLKPKPAPEAPNGDTELAQERHQIELARSALVRGNPRGAADALSRHASTFPSGALAEEREALWVQALVQLGEFDAARAKSAAFHKAYPDSVLWPAVEASLASIPR